MWAWVCHGTTGVRGMTAGGRIPARLAVSPSCLTGGALGAQILATWELQLWSSWCGAGALPSELTPRSCSCLHAQDPELELKGFSPPPPSQEANVKLTFKLYNLNWIATGVLEMGPSDGPLNLQMQKNPKIHKENFRKEWDEFDCILLHSKRLKLLPGLTAELVQHFEVT